MENGTLKNSIRPANKSMSQNIGWALLLLTIFSSTGCAINPVSKSHELVLMSEKKELALGQQYAASIAKQMPLLPADSPIVKYVDKVGQRIASVSDRPELYYRFNVVDDPTINAFALPGGHIYIYRGLLNHMNSEAELAAVLGHETGHVTARHAVQRFTQTQGYQIGMTIASAFLPIPQIAGAASNVLASAVIKGYGRQDELQADELSIKYIPKAGYDARATTRILETLQRLEDLRIKEAKDASGKAPKVYYGAFSSHPETKKRIKEAVAISARLQGPGGETGEEPMLAALNGSVYGDNPNEGAVIGQTFIHPKLGISIKFPSGWVIYNSTKALTARVRQKPVFFILMLKKIKSGQKSMDILRNIAGGYQVKNVKLSQRNGFSVASGIANTSVRKDEQSLMLITVLMDNKNAYILKSFTSESNFNSYKKDFESIAKSFNHYDMKRDGDIPRIHIVKWGANDSWQTLAKRSHKLLGKFTADKLAALNGMDISDTPLTGVLIKTVQ